MYVEMNSIKRFKNIKRDFGKIKPFDKSKAEISGPYCDGEYHSFLKYDPEANGWQVIESYIQEDKQLANARYLSREDYDGLVTVLRTLSDLPSPDMPMNIKDSLPSKPFIYEAWLFQWEFNKLLNRWEVVLIGKA